MEKITTENITNFFDKETIQILVDFCSRKQIEYSDIFLDRVSFHWNTCLFPRLMIKLDGEEIIYPIKIEDGLVYMPAIFKFNLDGSVNLLNTE